MYQCVITMWDASCGHLASLVNLVPLMPNPSILPHSLGLTFTYITSSMLCLLSKKRIWLI